MPDPTITTYREALLAMVEAHAPHLPTFTAALDAYRLEVLAERAMAVSWSESDESVLPRIRIMRDMKELTEVAGPDHRGRRCARTSNNLDDYATQVRTQAYNEAAAAVLLDTAHIRYGSATDYAERHADLLRRLAAAAPTATAATHQES